MDYVQSLNYSNEVFEVCHSIINEMVGAAFKIVIEPQIKRKAIKVASKYILKQYA